MKKIILVSLCFILLAAACQKQPIQQTPSNQNGNQSTSTDTSKLPQGEKEGWQTYVNFQYGFEVKYPNNFKLYTSVSQIKNLSFVPPCDPTMIACLFYSKDNERDTNYEGGGVSLNKVSAGTENSCLMGREGFMRKGDKTFNGVTFAAYEGSSAATGHWEQFRAYRTFKPGLCLEIVSRITGYNKENLADPSRIKEVNANNLWSKFEQVLSTFTFTSSVASANPPTKPTSPGKTTVEFGKQFTLKKNQTVYFTGSDAYVELTGFYYQPCPEGSQCFWSGLDVFYKFYAEGKTYTKDEILKNPLADSPFVLTLVDSDYKTYATFVVSKK